MCCESTDYIEINHCLKAIFVSCINCGRQEALFRQERARKEDWSEWIIR